MSNWVGAVTIASAMSGTVSDTRAMGDPTLRIVDRPTSRSISVGTVSAGSRGAGAVAAFAAVTSCGDCCAWGLATRITMMKPASADRNCFARGIIEVSFTFECCCQVG